MKIAVLGGSFDPPHIGHYLVVKQIQSLRPDIDKILLVPSFRHQWKPIQGSAQDRLAMLECLIDRGIELSDMEIKRKRGEYTIDTIRELKKQIDATFYFIVGSDIIYEFDRWKNTEELVQLTTFLVFPRDPYHVPKKIPKGFELIDDKNLITTNLSSTIIRDRIKNGQSIKYLVPKEVEKYIIKHKLYI